MAADLATTESRGPFPALLRLEFAEVRRSRWLALSTIVYLILAVVFLLVSMRESTVIGFTGLGRSLLSFTHVLIFLLPLLGLVATAQVINAARAEGALELLFGHPTPRNRWFLAVTTVRFGALAVPLCVIVPGMAIFATIAFGQPLPWLWLGKALLISVSLLVCFSAFGLLVSTLIRNQTRALLAVLGIWCASILLIDFGLVGWMLQSRLPPELVFLLAALNPVQSARMALLSSADAELATLGPVGFYLATRIGAFGLLSLGVVWPAFLGISTWLLAADRFRKSDLT